MTEVICCYAKLDTRTEMALRKYAPSALFVDTSADDYAYGRALHDHWTGKEDLIVIEQDIEISSDVISSFEECARDWCTYSYKMQPGLLNVWRTGPLMCNIALGCVRFSSALQKKVPFPENVSWRDLDNRVVSSILACKYEAHVHGEVVHHHYPEHQRHAIERP